MAVPAMMALMVGGQIHQQSQMRKAQRRAEEANKPTVEDGQRQSEIRSDRFEQESNRQRQLVRAMRGNTASAGMFSLLNPMNSKLGG